MFGHIESAAESLKMPCQCKTSESQAGEDWVVLPLKPVEWENKWQKMDKNKLVLTKQNK